MNIKIYNQNCFDLFKQFEKDNKEPFIDAVITDPPYNISKKNNFKTIGRNGIDFGKWDYNFNQTKWIKKISKFVKKGGSIIIFNDYKNFGIISSCLTKLGFEIKDLLRWIKKNPMPRNIFRRYVTDYEFAIWAVKIGGKWTFNKDGRKPYLRPEFNSSLVANSKHKIHPTQKPLKVIKELIKIHTNKNDLVVDPFLGSGTTAVACLQLKRNFIGSEIDKVYFDLSKKRLEEYEK